MTMLEINDRLAERLKSVSQIQNQPLETLLEEMLQLYETRRMNPILQMALSADELGHLADSDDIGANFEEELRQTRERHNT